jgi:Na+/H+ antiporter NhaD/arsenite permease-like protein
MPFSIIVIILIFILIAVRKIGRFKLELYQIMLLGAVLVLISGSISIKDAILSIDLDVILFLFGMFIIGSSMEESGLIELLSYRALRRFKNVDLLIIALLLLSGFSSALLLNDTIAVIGVPLILSISRRNNISLKLLTMTLAVGVTTGSVLSPIGNPQNLLIAVKSEMENPFVVFLRYLFFPTVISMLASYLVLRILFSREFRKKITRIEAISLKDPPLARLCNISIGIVIALITIKSLLFLTPLHINLRLTFISIGAAIPILMFSPKRTIILKRTDYKTLVFFASMFVVMQAVWNSGFIQTIIYRGGFNLLNKNTIIIISVVLSQILSNVPLVALILPVILIKEPSYSLLCALAAGSTIAGNLLLLGAASNIIIVQNLEQRKVEAISFLEFAKIGIPLTTIQVIIYILFI